MATDPCLVNNGSWDITAAIPTNSSPGALLTGPGEAWSHPHASNVLSHGWAEDGFYGGGDWAPIFNDIDTSVNCGSAAVLDNLPLAATLTVDGWFRNDGGLVEGLIAKGDVTSGWLVDIQGSGFLQFRVELATNDARTTSTTIVNDSKWHYYACCYVDATKTAYINVDGVWENSDIGIGAYQVDAALDLYMGRPSVAVWLYDGAIGWQRLSDNDRLGAVAGTDFISPRAFPAADGNTIEAWSMADGTGANVVAQVTSPGNDGTLANGTWEVQWNQLGSPVEFHGVEYNGTDTSGVIPDAARIQDLHGADMTLDIYGRFDGWGEAIASNLLDKREFGGGWEIYISTGNGLVARSIYAGGAALSASGIDEFIPDGKLHLLSAQLVFASRTWYLWVDGIPIASYHTQTAGAGVVTSDVGSDIFVGTNSIGTRTTEGMLGAWLRVSSTGRYTLGEAFVPDDPFNPPGTDANTAWQCDFTMDAGAGFLEDVSAGVNDATLTNYEWLHSFDMNLISPGSRIYGGQGYIVGANGANDGVIQTLTSLSPGADYVLRFVGHPGPDSNGHLNVLVYDEIGAANITDFDLPWYTGVHTGGAASAVLVAAAGTFSQRQIGAICWNIPDGSFGTITGVSGDGTTVTAPLGGGTSNDWQNGEQFRITWSQTGSVGNVVSRYPFNENFSFELPAGCTSFSVSLRETGGDGSWWVQQVSVQPNLWDDPGMEAGTAPTDVGTPTTSAQSAIQAHAATNSWRVITDAVDEGIERAITVVDGNYYHVSGWVFADTSGTVDMQVLGAEFQDGSTTTRVTTVNDIWELLGGVVRATTTTLRLRFLSNVAVQEFFVDDVAVIGDNDVTLTATPANEANSQE